LRYSKGVAETDESTTPQKSPEDMAYAAGYRLPDVQWPAELDEDDTRDLSKLQTPGVHHNPFDLRVPEQKAEAVAWLQGLKDRLTAPTRSPEEIVSDIDAAIGDSSDEA
jgi:hypothetical protein